MAGGKSNPPKARKRVEAAETLKRARDGSAFTKCEACNKDVPVVLIDMHSCSLDSKIRQSLEAQVVEKVVEAIKKPEKKRTAPSSQAKAKESGAKRSKKSNDSSGKRKRPPTAFFVFMEDFRKEYKEAHPDNKNVSQVAKEGGEKWKSLTEEEKKPYIEKAAQLKAQYEKAVEEDNNVEVVENEGEDVNEEQNGEESNEEQNGEDEKDSSDKEDDAVADKETENED